MLSLFHLSLHVFPFRCLFSAYFYISRCPLIESDKILVVLSLSAHSSEYFKIHIISIPYIDEPSSVLYVRSHEL